MWGRSIETKRKQINKYGINPFQDPKNYRYFRVVPNDVNAACSAVSDRGKHGLPSSSVRVKATVMEGRHMHRRSQP